MRIILIALSLLIIAYVIKVDLNEGGLNYTTFYETKDCVETFYIEKVRVKIQIGDTIHSLFAATNLETSMSFGERLSAFYELNPHLKKQALIAGESVYIPIAKKKKQSC